jgi:predicted acylesterase/phospholipase RssA
MGSTPAPARPRRQGALAALGLGAALLSGCIKTDVVAQAFNGGALDSSNGDPFHDPEDRKLGLVVRAIKDNLVDGYFGQSGDAAYVPAWLDEAAQVPADGAPSAFFQAVQNRCCAIDAPVADWCQADGRAQALAAAGTPLVPEDRRARREEAARGLLRARIAPPAADPARTLICDPNGKRNDEAARRFLDGVRYASAYARAVRAVAPLAIERLVDRKAIELGAQKAFREAAAYLRARRWRRSLESRTTALVVKGGASTGIYSAGVVWVAENLINECMNDPGCGQHGQRDLRVKLLSGTSTGAMIATAVDVFNTASTHADRRAAMRRLSQWFTCYGVNDLYCVQSRSIFDLAQDLQGVLEFDGIRTLLSGAVSCAMLDNTSELILNATDFRSGRIWALGDQDPAELRHTRQVVDAAVASAALPLIVQPVAHLPSDYDGAQAMTYLDGGIRSEIPLVPVVARGAERVVLVASAASVLGETRPLTSGLAIAQRYIDVSTGGVAERDVPFAQQYVESVRLAEIDECKAQLGGLPGAPSPCPEATCSAEALCEADWSSVCHPPVAAGPTTAPPPPPRLDETRDRVRHLFRLTSIFRDEAAVPGLHGYDFEPAELRRLFRAGVDAARVRCLELALTLGLPADDPRMKERLVRWCMPDLDPSDALCQGAPVVRPVPGTGIQTCAATPATYPDTDCGPGAPQRR